MVHYEQTVRERRAGPWTPEQQYLKDTSDAYIKTKSEEKRVAAEAEAERVAIEEEAAAAAIRPWFVTGVGTQRVLPAVSSKRL